MKGYIEIKLLSDLCAATGGGIQGVVHADVDHEFGLPRISAKRLKGALRNVALELSQSLPTLISEEDINILFGQAGAAKSSSLHLYDAHIYRDDQGELYDNYDELVREIKNQSLLTKEDILSYFTTLRTRTAIDVERGSAKEGSLRTMRVVHRGFVFRSRIELDDSREDTQHLEEILRYCVQGLRHLGMNVTRGYGEVSCTISKDDKFHEEKKEEDRFKIDSLEKETIIEQTFVLTLNSPLLIHSANTLHYACEDWIPGGVLLGALAAMYIQDHKLGSEAHMDETFRRIFLRHGISFGYAYPSFNNNVYYPCPQNIGKYKNKDIYKNQFLIDPVTTQEQVRKVNSLVSIVKPEKTDNIGKVLTYEPRKTIKMHHARPQNLGVATNRDAQVSPSSPPTGEFFQYVSLSQGQQFEGVLRGNKEDLAILRNCLLKRNGHLRLGRSRTAEYGDVEMEFISANTKEEKKCNDILLWLLSPTLLRDELGNSTCDPKYLINELKSFISGEVEIMDQFISFTQIGGYNSKWRLPKPQLEAIAQGSALRIQTTKEVDCMLLEAHRWGEQCGEGYGNIRFIPMCEMASTYEGYKEEDKIENQEITKKQQLLLNIKKIIEEQEEVNKAVEDASGTKLMNINATSISQLISWFDNSETRSYDELSKRIDNVKNGNKKKDMKTFIKCCDNKSEYFIKTYLLRARWNERKGGQK